MCNYNDDVTDKNYRKPKLGDVMNFGEVSDKVHIGEVKKWFSEKGFGFITSENKDYFVHITKVVAKIELEQGSKVEFKTLDTLKGVQAVEVVVINIQ